MSVRRGVTAPVLAIAAAVLAPLLAAGASPPSDGAWRELEGTWRLDAKRSGVPDGALGDGARTLRIEIDGPLLAVREDGGEARTLWVGGPPVEARAGAGTVTLTVSRSSGGVVVETTGGAPERESFELESGNGGRLLRTLSGPDGEPGAVTRLVYERGASVPKAASFPVLPACAAMSALALVFLAERGPGEGGRREPRVLAPAPGPRRGAPRAA